MSVVILPSRLQKRKLRFMAAPCALQEAGLFFHDADRRVETIDLADTVRSWKVNVCRAAPRNAEPFRVSAVIGFE